MDVVADLPADPQAPEVVQMRERPLDYPPMDTQAGAVFGLPAPDHEPDAEGQAPVLVVVVAAVCKSRVGAPAGPVPLAAHWGDSRQERDELGDVVAVATGECKSERDTVGIGDQMVLTARAALVLNSY